MRAKARAYLQVGFLFFFYVGKILCMGGTAIVCAQDGWRVMSERHRGARVRGRDTLGREPWMHARDETMVNFFKNLLPSKNPLPWHQWVFHYVYNGGCPTLVV